MPAFNTHWLVAILCRDSTLPEISRGFVVYKKAANRFKSRLISEFKRIAETSEKSDRKKSFKRLKKKRFDEYYDDFEKTLKDDLVYDNTTCFSAYMLGACGPDFWTVLGPGFETAGIHFDIGHYNRTHHQFKVAIKRWKEKKHRLTELQRKVEMSYFLGMATHIATDLIIHQLVNVYAGAYNLLNDAWENEHGNRTMTGMFKKWNTHNKVEHFWDSYIRYRYLGDYSYIWKGEDEKDLLMGEPLWFPTIENLIAHVNRMKAFDLQNDLVDWLKKDAVKWKIEKPFIFPRLACDRIMNRQGLGPFIYDVVVNKEIGAYPESDVFEQASKEAKSKQMKNGKGKSEDNKLAYFSTGQNQADPSASFNYLNYIVCPNLDRVKEYGLNVFYHLDALRPFVDSAVIVAKAFLNGLSTAIGDNDESNIGPLDHFWNLDTGLGLKVRNIRGETPLEVITQLDFVHITDFMKDAVIKYNNYSANLHCMTGGKGKRKDKSETFEGNPSQKTAAFKTYQQGKPYKDLSEVEEVEYPEEVRYVEQIKLENPEFYKSDMKVDQFFEPVKKAENTAQPAATQSTKEENKLQVRYINHRLTLRIKTAIPHFCTDFKTEDLGCYFYGDSTFACTQYKEHMGSEWLADKQTKVQDFDYTNKSHYQNLLRFKTHLLLNFENDKNIQRKISPGLWNNAVNFEKHKEHYSRNYAVGTGRKHVLHPDGDGRFWAAEDFKHYTNISPTEHVFFPFISLSEPKKVFSTC